MSRRERGQDISLKMGNATFKRQGSVNNEGSPKYEPVAGLSSTVLEVVEMAEM